MIKQIIKNKPAVDITGKTYFINNKKVVSFGNIDLFDEEDDDGYLISEHISFQIKIGSKIIFSFIFDISEFPGNCSIFVLHDLVVTSKEVENTILKELTTILDGLIKSGCTFSITTNGTKPYILIEKALNSSKYWTKVKSYKSASSGNIISIFMTNNN